MTAASLRNELCVGLFLASPDPVLLMEAKTRRIVEVNPAAEKFYGYTRDQFLKLSGPDVSAEPDETRKDMDRVARGEKTHIHVRYHRKCDGTVATVEISGGSFKVGDAEYVFGVIRPLEVLEPGRIRERELAREIEHRIKNAMATIRGLVWLLKDGAKSVDEFAREIGDRIQAMANLHESLAGRGWGHANLERLVEDSTLGNPQVVCSGEKYVVDATVAIPLGQVFFELHANSLRHGALSAESARVEVSWNVAHDERCIVCWREVGGPEIDASPRPGTGTLLISSLVEQEIGGRLELDFRSDGLQAVIELPARAS